MPNAFSALIFQMAITRSNYHEVGVGNILVLLFYLSFSQFFFNLSWPHTSAIFNEEIRIEHGQDCSSYPKEERPRKSQIFLDNTTEKHAREKTDGKEAI